MALYRLTKPQPFLFITFPEIQIQAVHTTGDKKNSTCMKKEPVSAGNTCAVLKMRLPRRTGEVRTKQDAVLSVRATLKYSPTEIHFCPKRRHLRSFSDPITQRGANVLPLPLPPQNATEEKSPCLGAAGQISYHL